ncbi:MAG TPA: hypothetical protein VEU30_05905, partial [Thermoanaerobaculia bacterium]|nr:hypothetical protein [Thermoanaerobaculia bacterium]
MWLAMLLSLAFIGPPEADPIERYLAKLQPVCDAYDFTPQYEVFDCWPNESPRTVVAMYTSG